MKRIDAQSLGSSISASFSSNADGFLLHSTSGSGLSAIQIDSNQIPKDATQTMRKRSLMSSLQECLLTPHAQQAFGSVDPESALTEYRKVDGDCYIEYGSDQQCTILFPRREAAKVRIHPSDGTHIEAASREDHQYLWNVLQSMLVVL